MKTDLYTKIVLTIIAVILFINLFKATISTAQADGKTYVSLPVNADGTINVRFKQLKNETLDVNIASTSYNALDNVEPLRVKIKN